jgi:hypothetical protein
VIEGNQSVITIVFRITASGTVGYDNLSSLKREVANKVEVRWCAVLGHDWNRRRPGTDVVADFYGRASEGNNAIG